MNSFSLLIKPASADCNLRCEYCFYLDHCSFYPETKIHRMPDKVLETLIYKFMHTEQPQYVFAFQGGEPTLMGLNFFKKVVFWQRKFGSPGVSIGNGLQTNATLIDEDMARFFSEYKFLLGVSLDGPESVHNRYRLDNGGKGSHYQVMRGIERLLAHQVEFNILTLVSQANVIDARAVYEYLKSNGFLYHQYIPCVEFDENGTLLPFAITGDQWGQFLCDLFDAWYENDTRRVSIRLFDCILNYMVDGRYTACHMGTNCCQYFVVEYNGDIFPCDFFVQKDLYIGNILNIDWDQAAKSSVYRDFGRQKNRWHASCTECEYLPYCAGDCIKHRLCQDVKPENLSFLCNGWKKFYAHTLNRFRILADEIKKARKQPAAPVSEAVFKRTGRNDPCPCGSGRKFKQCCGKSR